MSKSEEVAALCADVLVALCKRYRTGPPDKIAQRAAMLVREGLAWRAHDGSIVFHPAAAGVTRGDQ
jgi:hypothetical protein